MIDDFNREALGIEVDFEHIQPGKPQQNAYVERFNRTVRYEWLSQYYWSDLDEVRSTPRCGCGTTTMNAQTWPCAGSPPNSGWPWPHSSTFQSGGLWGDDQGCFVKMAGPNQAVQVNCALPAAALQPSMHLIGSE